MMPKKFRIDLYGVALIFLVAIFILIKIPYLSLPYYWDEAWVYGPAVRIMEAGKLSLLPNALPVDYSRGHPLLFHFLCAIWLRIFGTSLLSSHIFALFISVCLILSIYIFCSKLISKQAGIMAATVLVLQPIFLAQSVLVLPEVMLSLFSLLSIYFFIKKKWLWYIVFTTFALYTKETGIVVVATACLWFLIDMFLLRWKEFKINEFLLQSLYLFIPVLFISVFFILQKNENGWYFFPEHINRIKNDSRTFSDKFESYSAYLFIYWGRNFITAVTIISLTLYFYLGKFRKNKLNKPLLILAIFTILYLAASSINFYSDRYSLCMIAPFIIITVLLLNEIFKNKIYIYLIVAVYAVIQLIHYIPKKTSSDHNLGYAESVKTHQEMVKYCNVNHFNHKIIFTHFLMVHNLTNPYCGYIDDSEKFTKVSSTFTDSTELCIFSNMEGQDECERIKSTGKLKLLKRFDSYQAWCEIYMVDRK
jgi:4-amino-4-deoxy-L-arabinose transferase-like glycosyltransferase